MNLIDNYIDEHIDSSIDELGRLCAQPSVGAQNWGLTECAAMVGEMLESRGFSVNIMSTNGAPVVFGERSGNSDKTLLIYNHYDVQPPEPLELWDSPPFELTRRDDKYYARGISDDKGHITSRLHAIDAILAQQGDLPCSIKFIIEGEEETSSTNLYSFIENNQELLQADACLWEFGGVDFRDVPMQYLGLRGICYVELSVETANVDTHSGIGGSIFPNAAWRLTWALNSLKDENEHIKIPGFYDDIVPPSERDIDYLRSLPDIAEDYKKRFGVKSFLHGITGGVDLHKSEYFQPTCTICGLNSGYQGPGSKTVLPAKASAKIDFRLVPDQKPGRILKLLREHLDREGFEDIKIEFLGGEPAARTDPDDPFVKMVIQSAEPVYGQQMQIIPMIGGSGPNHPFIHLLKLPVVTAGVGYPGSNAHAPNENIRLDLYIKHAKHVARIINNINSL